MKAIMVMFDSLNRHMLSPYGCDWIKTPNFERLAEKTVKFTKNYAGSLPCMPARRELHTGRLNFLHRSWGPLEPFDDSMPEILKKNGIYTHLTSDHHHYWEEGGANYHTKYSSWNISRGQEGDPWHASVRDPEIPPSVSVKYGEYWRQYWVNRKHIKSETDMPIYKTFANGLDFIRNNVNEDNWFLQIESFDPHEPFFALEHYKNLYPHFYNSKYFDWPPYEQVNQTAEEIEHLRYQYAATMSMCDHYLGTVIDLMDELNMWEDTMLIVNTDHGHLLSEHDWWGKCTAPMYEEIAHIPLFIWDPRSGIKGRVCDQLVQTIDLAPTLLEYFNINIPKDMQGKPLRKVIEYNEKIHDAVIFGIFGGHVNCTDGKYVYMRAPNSKFKGDPYAGENLYNYTLMPAHIRGPFTLDELKTTELSGPFSFTKNIPVMKISGEIRLTVIGKGKKPKVYFKNMLFNLDEDPYQKKEITDLEIEKNMQNHIKNLMKENDAPLEQFLRLNL